MTNHTLFNINILCRVYSWPQALIPIGSSIGFYCFDDDGGDKYRVTYREVYVFGFRVFRAVLSMDASPPAMALGATWTVTK